MSKRLIYLTAFVVVLGLAGGVSAVPNPVAWWKLNESSGTTSSDSSGNGYNGTLVDGVTWMPTGGKFGGAASFAGGSQRIEFSSAGMSASAGTVALWARPEGPQTQHYRYFFAVRDLPGGGNRVQLYLYQTTMQLGAGLGDAFDRNTNIQVLSTNTWYHIVLTWNGTNWAVYVDNVQKASGTYTGLTRMTTGGDIGNDHQDRDKALYGLIDDVGVWNSVLSTSDIQSIYLYGIVAPGKATNPSPANGAIDVPRDVSLIWTPGIYAPPINGHRVYLSENFNDVNDGIGGIARDANSYAPAQRLDFGTTYYWRVDEVNGPPDYTVYEGGVWSFTTEPIGYPIENIIATASSAQQADMGPENTINGSGLDDNDLHSMEATDMWLSSTEPLGAWIEFQFDKVYKLHELWVWNSNQMVELVVGFGFKDVTIEHSTNGTDWTTLSDAAQFAQAPGADGYAHNTTVDFGGELAKYVRITAASNWGGIMPQYGLSEVRFFYIPVRAREPSPDSGATDVDVDVTLGFRAGREAASHDVYLSTDEQAVIDGTAPATTVTETGHGPLSLDLGKTYFWRVDEVNEAKTPTTWEGDLWNFATRQFLVVDDFESYNDLDPGDPESNRIFHTWIDGYEQPTNGSIVGYAEPPFTEQSIVHGDKQSMPLAYDNTGTAAYSEAERTFAAAQNWTQAGAATLVLYFHGAEGNTGQLYVKVDGSKVVYDGDAGDIAKVEWKQWNIDLASLGAGVQNVTKLAIGIDGNGATGTLYVDDIRLYRLAPQAN